MKVQKIRDLILVETEDYACINKPPFVPSVAERGKFTNIPVLDQVKSLWPDATLCHRLDRETSGVLIVAKNAAAYRHASIQFENRKVEKIYHAIVESHVSFDNHIVDLPINTDKLNRIRIDLKHGKQAKTTFNSLEHFKHYTLVECKPESGRLHQIRVHLASQNARIAGDELYGGRIPQLSFIKPRFRGKDSQLMARFALHACSIRLPLDNSQFLTADAPYFKDFEVFLKLLRQYDT